MKILDIRRDIEDSLASLATAPLPPALEGLRHLPVGDRNPHVRIRNRDKGRNVREDADARYFDPDSCEVVIRFEPVEAAHKEDEGQVSNALRSEERVDAFDFGTAVDQLLDALQQAERTRPFVGLKWFRDQFLPLSGHDWARDSRTSGSLLRHATDQRLVLTSQAPNPNQPHHPITAIRVNRRHPRFQPGKSVRDSGFRPIRIRGGSISDTVLAERR